MKRDAPSYVEMPPGGGSAPTPAAPDSQQPHITATPFVWRDPGSIPRRAFVFGHHYARQFVSTTIAKGGGGKTSLILAEALSMATGRPLLGITPRERVKVWIWNGEDPREEIERRVVAAMIHYGIQPEEVEGWLFFDSGRDMEISIAKQGKNGSIEINQAAVDEITRTAIANEISVIFIDPFVASHRTPENDNNAIDVVVKAWGRIAQAANCSIELIHHARKTGAGVEIDVEDGRGARALIDGCRSARTVNGMNKTEAGIAGIDKPRGYFRVDNGKANLAPPPEKADWYRLVSVPLGNGDPNDRLDQGDKVAVVTIYEFPDALATATIENLREAQREVATGGPWRKDVQCPDWVGVPIAKAMGLDLKDPTEKAKVKAALKTWMLTGMFVEAEGEDKHRKTRTFVEVGEWATD